MFSCCWVASKIPLCGRVSNTLREPRLPPGCVQCRQLASPWILRCHRSLRKDAGFTSHQTQTDAFDRPTA